MKNTVTFYIMLLCSLSLWAQPVHTYNERAYVHLDKDCYVAGEEVLVKLLVIDNTFCPSTFSKVGYIEICDTEKVRAQLKLALDKGVGAGKLTIPLDVPSGIYQLTGYTRYMRNEDADMAFKREIAIVNMATTSEEDRIKLVGEEEKYPLHIIRESTNVEVLTDKKVYSNRNRVDVSLRNLPSDIMDLVISVSRNDSITNVAPVDKNEWRNMVSRKSHLPTPWQWVPEYEGHIITGRTFPQSREGEVPSSTEYDTNISFVGSDMRYIHGQRRDEHLSYFYTGDIYGSQEIVTSVNSYTGDALCVDILSPFAEQLPASLPPLQIAAEDPALMDRFVGVQLQQIMGVDSLGHRQPLEDYYYYRTPTIYDLNEYTRFKTVGETIIEFVNKIVVRKGKLDRRVLKVMIVDERRYSTGNTLVLLDGVAIHNHEEILNYNPYNIRTIKVYDGMYLFGGEVYECMVSFVTHRQSLSSIQLNDASQLFAYECPMLPEEFNAPEYLSKEDRYALSPDFRHTLYWNPFLEQRAVNGVLDLSFYTSDMIGEYKIIVEGFTKEGKDIYGTALFGVEE